MYCQRNGAGAGSRSVAADIRRRDLAESRVAEERGDRVGVVHREHRAHEAAEVGADVLDDRLLHELERGLDAPGVLTTTPPPGTSTRRISATAAGSVLHEHQSHLAQDDVVGVVGERERAGVAHVPVDR